MKCWFSLARSLNLVEKTNREPAVAKKQTWEKIFFQMSGESKKRRRSQPDKREGLLVRGQVLVWGGPGLWGHGRVLKDWGLTGPARTNGKGWRGSSQHHQMGHLPHSWLFWMEYRVCAEYLAVTWTGKGPRETHFPGPSIVLNSKAF